MDKKQDKKPMDDVVKSISTLSEIIQHKDIAEAELSARVNHKTQGFDTYDHLFRSHLTAKNWPYRSKIFDPRTFTAIIRKTSRLIAGRLRGRFYGRGPEDELGAAIQTELVGYDWDTANRGGDMVAKWARMDMNTRKYGAAFALVPWRRERNFKGDVVFDGPEFEPLENRDCLPQPGARTEDECEWFIVRRYVTIQELESVNDRAVYGPVYKNLEQAKALLDGRLKKQYNSVNKEIKGLDSDPAQTKKFGRVEVLTEYRKDKWITWIPNQSGNQTGGIIIREMDNPYEHGMIPIVRLVYYPIDDDIYGVSELEPIVAIQKAINAFLSHALDTANQDLNPVLMVNEENVQIDTLEWKPNAKWFMDNPGTDVQLLNKNNSGTIGEFIQLYQLLNASMQEALGETAQDVSNQVAGGQDKTATEVKDLALLRSARDNFNQLFLKASMTKMVKMWASMNKQYLTKNKIVRIAGKEALQFFINKELDGYTLTEEGFETIDELTSQNGASFDEVYTQLQETGQLEQFLEPLYKGEGGLPKLRMNEDGTQGYLSVGPSDLGDDMDYVCDIESMSLPNDQQNANSRVAFWNIVKEAEQQLANEGFKFKYKEGIAKIGEALRIKDADSLFEKLTPQPQMPQNGMMAGQQQEQPPMGATPSDGMGGGAQQPVQPPMNGQQQPQMSMPQIPQGPQSIPAAVQQTMTRGNFSGKAFA